MRVYAWTFLSGSLYSSASFIILMLVTNALDGYWGGVVAIALALSQQIFTLGSFNMRRYQVSDTTGRFGFVDYLGSRLVTCTLMIALGLAWAAFGDFSPDKRAAITWFVIQKASEAFSDVLEGHYQLLGRFDVSGRVLALKSSLSTASFAIALFCTRSLPVSLAAMAITHLALFFIADLPILFELHAFPLPRPPRLSRILPLLGASFPLAIDSFMRMYINNGPKFAIDRIMDEQSTAAYSSLFMVSFVVAIFSDFIINPQIVPLSRAYHEGRRVVFHRALLRQLAIVLALGAAGLVGAWFLGTQVLSFVFGIDLAPYRVELCILLTGGVFLALYQVAQLVLIVLRRQVWCLLAIGVAAGFVFRLASRFVTQWMLKGAAICYCCAMVLLFLVALLTATCFLCISEKKVTI